MNEQNTTTKAARRAELLFLVGDWASLIFMLTCSITPLLIAGIIIRAMMQQPA